MKNLILILLALAAAVGLTLLVQDDNGYLLIGYGEWTIEGSLAFFVLLNLVAFVAFYLLLRLVIRLWSMPRGIRRWSSERRRRKAQKALNQGLVALSEGDWRSAERQLVRNALQAETPLVNYLAAARSAQQQGQPERRDRYLQLAHESTPKADVAVGLTQAELQIADGKLEQALATLQHLHQIAPRHAHVLKLLKELYLRLNDWQELHRLLPELKKQQLISDKERSELELNIYRDQLNRAAAEEEVKALTDCWKSIPWAVRSREEMVLVYANLLLNKGYGRQVEDLLKDAIDRHWSDELVELYGRIEVPDTARQLSNAEGWLRDRPRNPVLLLTLGRLCLRNRLWGKARSYLEASVGVESSAAAYQELGSLLEHLDEPLKALNCYKAGLALSTECAFSDLAPALEQGKEPRLEAPQEQGGKEEKGEAGAAAAQGTTG